MTTSRRDLCLALPALALLAQSAAASETSSTPPALAHNHIFKFNDLTARPNGGGGESRAVTHGMLPTGEGVELHHSTLAAGKEPHPPHRHLHEEFLLIREGQLLWLSGEKQAPIGPGDIVYNSSNELHGLRNIGSTVASYFVVAIGPDLKSV